MKYKSTLIILLTTLFMINIVNAEENIKKINFNSEKNFKTIFEIAKKENKLIFFDAYTKWCYPCRKLNKTTFKNTKVIKTINDNFISYHMNMDKNEAKPFAQKYNILTYPALFFLNYDGEIIIKSHGYVTPKKLLTYAKKAMKANGKLAILKSQPSIDKLFKNYFAQPNGKNYKKIKKKLVELMHLNDTSKIKKIYEIANKQDKTKRLEMKLQMDTAITNQNWKLYEKLTLSYYNKYKKFSPMEYKKSAYIFYSHIKDKNSLKKAIQWLEEIPLKKLSKEDLEVKNNLKLKIN